MLQVRKARRKSKQAQTLLQKKIHLNHEISQKPILNELQNRTQKIIHRPATSPSTPVQTFPAVTPKKYPQVWL